MYLVKEATVMIAIYIAFTVAHAMQLNHRLLQLPHRPEHERG
jgi:hypothetical protein